jgi:Ion channel
MAAKARSAPDLLLLLSLFSVILLNPVLDQGDFRKLILAGLTFVPVIFATIRLSEKRSWVWPSVLLMSLAAIFGVMSILISNRVLVAIKWGLFAAFFALTVVGLFSYLTNARSVLRAHLYTAVSVYLLLGMTWFALYCAIDAAFPGSFEYTNKIVANRQSELLYFSLITLTTIGYGDILPLNGEARMLAALEGVIGVLYVAITVAILVSAFKRQEPSSRE